MSFNMHIKKKVDKISCVLQANSWHVIKEVVSSTTRAVQMLCLTSFVWGALDADLFSNIFGTISVVGFLPHMASTMGSVFGQVTGLLSSLKENCMPVLEYLMEIDVGGALEIIEEHDEGLGEEITAAVGLAAVAAGAAAATRKKKDNTKQEGSDSPSMSHMSTRSQMSANQLHRGTHNSKGSSAMSARPSHDCTKFSNREHVTDDNKPVRCQPSMSGSFVFLTFKHFKWKKKPEHSTDGQCYGNISEKALEQTSAKRSLQFASAQPTKFHPVVQKASAHIAQDSNIQALSPRPPTAFAMLPQPMSPANHAALSPRPSLFSSSRPNSPFSPRQHYEEGARSHPAALILPAMPPVVHLNYRAMSSSLPPANSMPNPLGSKTKEPNTQAVLSPTQKHQPTPSHSPALATHPPYLAAPASPVPTFVTSPMSPATPYCTMAPYSPAWTLRHAVQSAFTSPVEQHWPVSSPFIQVGAICCAI
jgi:hypothetical protein